jgi:ribosomal protein S18 acetylase RimI-like enzyme
MHGVTLREMTREDVPEVSRVVCAAFSWAAQREGLPAEEIESYVTGRGSVESIEKESNDCTFWVAVTDGQLCGAVAAYENEITKLYLLPALHGQGIGRRLFELAQRCIAEGGYAELTAWAAFDVAIPFYEKMGMETAGRKYDLLGKTRGRNTMCMKKSLRGMEHHDEG